MWSMPSLPSLVVKREARGGSGEGKAQLAITVFENASIRRAVLGKGNAVGSASSLIGGSKSGRPSEIPTIGTPDSCSLSSPYLFSPDS